MIKVNDVCKSFDGFVALNHTNMHVPKGSIYGLVGPNGAGKSTIIRHITGAYKQDFGEILVGGEPVYENPKTKAKFAYIPDEIFYFSQANTMDMMKYYKGIYKTFDEDLFHKLAVCFPEINVKRNIRNLSKGMQKQVAFWLSICVRPELIILDEPVDGLDPVMRRQIWSLIMSDVAEFGTTVLVSSHNLRELEDVCDYVGIMNKGKVMVERSLNDLQSSITKIQVAFDKEMPPIPHGLELLHKVSTGRVHTLILKGEPKEAEMKLATLDPLIMDVLPLTLEEIFIYELGGEDYAVKDIIF
ncbi:MAG: ABC transporter ATP-binding protein [Lachnospiraceae bacterium]|nr:ABC transporter ATP-binding protein [Lachnospiraceae bacterium]